MPVIIKDLTKRFGDKTVLDHFSLVLPDSGVVFIGGPSGAGKTTLLRLLMGLIPPDGGTIRGLEKRSFTAVFQENRLLERQSVLKNLRLVCPRRVSDDEIRCHLREVGLSGTENSAVQTLSGGMQRRVALVRAVLAEGGILVLDEPFKGLDDAAKALATDYVKRRAADRLVLLVTHDVREAETLGAVQTVLLGQ